MKRWSFLLLDANVVIALFKMGIWERVVAECDLHVAETVIGEAHFFEDEKGERQDFDVGGHVARGKIKRFSVPAAAVKAFVETFGSDYIEKLDAGEAESLAHLERAPGDWLIARRTRSCFACWGIWIEGSRGFRSRKCSRRWGWGGSCRGSLRRG